MLWDGLKCFNESHESHFNRCKFRHWDNIMVKRNCNTPSAKTHSKENEHILTIMAVDGRFKHVTEKVSCYLHSKPLLNRAQKRIFNRNGNNKIYRSRCIGYGWIILSEETKHYSELHYVRHYKLKICRKSWSIILTVPNLICKVYGIVLYVYLHQFYIPAIGSFEPWFIGVTNAMEFLQTGRLAYFVSFLLRLAIIFFSVFVLWRFVHL